MRYLLFEMSRFVVMCPPQTWSSSNDQSQAHMWWCDGTNVLAERQRWFADFVSHGSSVCIGDCDSSLQMSLSQHCVQICQKWCIFKGIKNMAPLGGLYCFCSKETSFFCRKKKVKFKMDAHFHHARPMFITQSVCETTNQCCHLISLVVNSHNLTIHAPIV